jgi:hypothetical protein
MESDTPTKPRARKPVGISAGSQHDNIVLPPLAIVSGSYAEIPRTRGPRYPVIDILLEAPPSHAPSYKEKQTTATRDPTAYDFDIPVIEQLKLVTVVHTMVDQLRAKASDLMEAFTVDPSDIDDQVFITLLHPYYTSRSLPVRTFSEHDSEDWVWAVLIRPAIALVKAILTGSLRSDPTQQFPNVSSSGGKDPIPDGIVSEDDGQINATVEIKTHRALLSESTRTKKQTFADMMASWPNMPVGRAMKFNWPVDADDAEGISTESKILIQVKSCTSCRNVETVNMCSGICSDACKGCGLRHPVLFSKHVLLC